MHDSAEDQRPDATDQLLTAALQSYAKPQQRYGLETRLLAAAAQERNTRRPRALLWLGAGFAAVAAVLLIVVCLPRFHARLQPEPEAVQQLRLPAPPAVVLPGSPAHSTLTAFHRVRKAHRQQAPQTISRPFPQLAPSRQEFLLLNLTEAQGKALMSLHNAGPAPIAPIEISAIHIEPIQDKPLDQ